MADAIGPDGELGLFAGAVNWKAYWQRMLAPWIRGDVLEVGAGIGTNTVELARAHACRWLAIEPDPARCAAAQARVAAAGLGARVEVACGAITDVSEGATFDTVIYCDVLEHIADDRAEIVRATARLRPDGCLVVLAPAHQWLFSPFDRAIGHVRRYTRRGLLAAAPPDLVPVAAFYLDAVGLLAALGNRLWLRRAMPSPGHIRSWDRGMIPLSRVLDRLLAFSVGKSVVAVWRRPDVPGVRDARRGMC